MTAQIHRGLTYEQYAALPGWRWSHIKMMEISPRHVAHAVATKDTDTASRTMLRAIHALVLEPGNFERSFSVYEGRRNKNDKAYQHHLAMCPGTAVLNDREYEVANETAKAILGHDEASRLLDAGEPEVTIQWTDAATGLLCKARIDSLSTAWFVDLKTYGTVIERAVAAQVTKQTAHGQLAHYDEGLAAVGLPGLSAYVISAEGKSAQDVACFELDRGGPDGALYRGRQLRAGFMARLAECVATDKWPGRHPEILSLALPRYALDDEALDDMQADNDDIDNNAEVAP